MKVRCLVKRNRGKIVSQHNPFLGLHFAQEDLTCFEYLSPTAL